MRVLETHIADARYARDFGRIEARVHILIEDRPGAGTRGESISVSVPARSRVEGKTLRDRITSEAETMLRLLQKTNRQISAAMAA